MAVPVNVELKYAAVAFHAELFCNPRPLAEYFVGMRGRELSRQAHFFRVRDTVNEQCFGAHKLAETAGEVTRRCARRDNNMRTHNQDNEKDFQSHPQEAEFGVTVPVGYREETVSANVTAAFLFNGCESNFASSKGWSQSQELDPVPTA